MIYWLLPATVWPACSAHLLLEKFGFMNLQVNQDSNKQDENWKFNTSKLVFDTEKSVFENPIILSYLSC